MKKVKHWLSAACIYYTIISLSLLLLRVLLSGFSQGSISVLSFFMVFPCSLLLASSLFWKENLWSGAAKRLLHFFTVLTAFFLFLWIPYNASAKALTHIFVLLFISAIYWSVILIQSVSKKRMAKMQEEEIS